MKRCCIYFLLVVLNYTISSLWALSSDSASTIPSPVANPKMKPASELIAKQDPVKINQTILDRASNSPVAILVSISKQRAYLLVGGEVAVDSPISSGKRNGWTPRGDFCILEKDPDHQSTLYGDFVDTRGRIVRSGISSKLDAAPSGTHFRGAPMKYFMRLTPQGVGMHVGILPGYPASHGCVRMPTESAQIFFEKAAVQTPVTVTD